MTASVLGSLDDLEPDWLTEVLGRSCALDGARVSEVAVTKRGPSANGSWAQISPSWAPAAPKEAPARLFLKMTKKANAPGPRLPAGAGEVIFYRDVRPLVADLPVPRCYDVAHDEASGRFHLILEDLSETHHVVTQWPVAPSFEQCKGIVATFARLHAAWWDDPRPGVMLARFVEPPETYVEAYGRALAAFSDRLGDRLSATRRRRYERVLAATGNLLRRDRTGRNVTLVHGDAHAWNLHYPKEGAATGIRLTDWDSFGSPHTGAYDLACFMALHWYPERRRRYEADLLAHYHDALEAGGVRGYTLEALRDDYRHAVIQNLQAPMVLSGAGVPPAVWWDHLERIMLAFEDLGCESRLAARST